MRRLAQIGWLSKGFVFIVIGMLAIQIALTDWGGANSDNEAVQEGALQAVADQPFGVALLTATAVGLALFMVWNIVQACIPDSTDLDLMGITQRIGWFGLGLFYVSLAFTGLRLAWTEANSRNGSGASGNRNDETDPKELTAGLFELPGGRWIAGLIAIGVLVVAGSHLYKGVSVQRRVTPVRGRPRHRRPQRHPADVSRQTWLGRSASWRRCSAAGSCSRPWVWVSCSLACTTC